MRTPVRVHIHTHTELCDAWCVFQGQVEQTLTLQSRPDGVLEGRETFLVSLVAADNNADISPTGIALLFHWQQVCLLITVLTSYLQLLHDCY